MSTTVLAPLPSLPRQCYKAVTVVLCLDNSVKQTVMEKYHTNATAVIMTFDTIQTEVRTLVYIIYSHFYDFSGVGLIFVINLGQAL